jgi:hypothetical protein
MFRRLSRFHRVLPALACLLALGCGGDAVYHVSGKVTFQGKDVPAGKIYFSPDGAKGATGPTGFADIKDGKYDTSDGGRGVPAGPVVISIEGLDPSSRPEKEKSEDVTAKVLFPRYEVAFDMPKEKTTKDIEVPADAAKGPKQVNKKAEIIP